MFTEQGTKELLALQYNKPVARLPTYTLNKYRFIGQLLSPLLLQEKDSPIRIVELGCGNRGLAETYILPEHNRNNITYVGIDSNIGLSLSPTVLGDIAFTPTVSSCADVVLCLDVLEHIKSKHISHVMEEIARIAKPKGNILISVPSMYNLDRFHIPSIQFGTHETKLTPHEWIDFIEKYISITETMGIGIFEVIPYLPQFLKLVNQNFPLSFINSLYKTLKQLDLGRLDPLLYKVGLNHSPYIREFCDGFLMIGSKKV